MNGLDRREFCRLLGGGIVVIITTKPADLFAQRTNYPEDPNAYLRIDANGKVTLFSGKIEMGQGVHTSLAQMAADELGVSLDAVTVVMGDTDLVPYDAGTWGSLTTRFFGPAVRAAAAEARTVLMDIAANRLNVPRAGLVAADGWIFPPGEKLKGFPIGELAKGRNITRLVNEKAVLRSVKEFTVMGTSPRRLDARAKVTGRAKYAGDIRVPGMLYARVLRPPAHGALAKTLKFSKAEAVPGVTVVQDHGLLAVLHEDQEVAAHALSLVEVEWTRPDAPFGTDSVHDYWLKNAGAGDAKSTRGDVTQIPDAITGTYRTGYLAHAPMEPHTALAHMQDGRMIVYASTQSPFGARTEIANDLGMSEKDVRVITPFVGGGFGGKSANGQAIEAARYAKTTGRPVMVMWTRSDEFYNDTFGPAAVIKINSAVDGDGRITHWDYNVFAAGTRSADVFYDIPNARLTAYMARGSAGSKLHPFAVGPWRAPGAPMNVFAKESQIDIMAAKAKIDPLEFRLRNTTDERARRVLKTAAQGFGWKAAAGPSGQGRGIAVSTDAGSYSAIAAEVAVDRNTGVVTVKRLIAAQDMGQVINPEGARMQMEGCMTMGLGYVFSEELRFNGGEILDRNFDTYELPRFSRVPVMTALLVKNDELSPQGGGEPAIVPLGAAIANAVFDATGARVFRLPMTPERVKAALAGA